MEDDDEIIEIWYVIGVAALGMRPPDCELARHHLEHARDMLNVIYEQTGPEFPFGTQLCLVEEHLKILEAQEQSILVRSGGGESSRTFPDQSMDEEKDEEWSDDDRDV